MFELVHRVREESSKIKGTGPRVVEGVAEDCESCRSGRESEAQRKLLHQKPGSLNGFLLEGTTLSAVVLLL